jgi:hypothetical protein
MYIASKTAKKNQSCVKQIKYQKIYLLQLWSFYECYKDEFSIYKPVGSAVHKTVPKFSARNTNMFALFGFSCTCFAVTIYPALLLIVGIITSLKIIPNRTSLN